MAGLNRQGNDFLFGVAASAADPRALAPKFQPAGFGSHVAEPEWESTTLDGPVAVNGTLTVEKQAAAVLVFTDAVAVFVWIEKVGHKAFGWKLQGMGNGFDLLRTDIDGTRRARAALAALGAFELQTVVEKVCAILP